MTHTSSTRLDVDAADLSSFVRHVYQVLREPAVRTAWYEAAGVFAAEIEAVLKAVSETRAAWLRDA